VGGESDMFLGVFTHIPGKSTVSNNERLREFAEEARLADALGLDYYFTAEHHFSREFSLSPTQALSLAVVATVTERIRLGPMVVLLPISQPLRVAEEMAILDHMSNGRLDVGIGRGIVAHEHLTFGVDFGEGYDRLAEATELLLKAWTHEERFSWMGKHYRYFDVEMPYRPVQQPHPPIWLPTGTVATAEDLGRRGFHTAGFSFLGFDFYREVFAAHRAGWDEAGRAAEDYRLGWAATVVVADSDAEAEALARTHFPRQVELIEYEERRSYDMVTDRKLKGFYRGALDLEEKLHDFGHAEREMAIVHGSPSTVAEKIETLRRELGVNTFLGEFNFGLLDYGTVERSLTLFAEEVAPVVRRSPAPAGTG
jgi:alkanesulfonate monooxygenase SsuD/methylene tetrahydromethanopterin reductase-like flavin-dependent oxidoreductase (luciferase family)